MKKIFILAAFAVAALASCQKNEVIDVKQNEIKFSVVTENQTKAEEVFCANKIMESFKVTGTYTKDATTSWYFKDDIINYVDSKWVNATNTRYWSADGTHTFYAIVNGTMITAETPAPPTVSFTPETTVADQKDLLYAVATGKTKVATLINLNFRHALSQIEFRAKNTNTNLYVEISGVKVGQTPGEGTFTYPADATDANFADHTQGTVANPALNTGTWAVNTATDYTVTFDAIPVVGDNTPVDLTISTDANDNTRAFLRSMLLLPTPATTAWAPAVTAATYDGTYLAVKCKIYNVAGNAVDTNTDAVLYDNWAVMPVSFTWDPGKKYIYTFVFGDGNGGYTDDPNNPQPVLTPIDYTVTVDDFQLGYNEDVEMEF